MRLDPGVFMRAVTAVVVFIVFASAALLRSAPAATGASPESPAVESVPGDSSDLPCRVSSQYPHDVLQWCGWITYFAEAHDLSPDLVAGLVWYESGGKPGAISRSGAVGLMQVMPRDGPAAKFMCVNGPCFASRPTRQELEDPEFNLEFGTRMLSGLVSRHQSLRDGLKSYGPAGVGYTYADKVLAIYERYRED